MKVVTLDLPLPPSVNALYRNVRGKGRVRSNRYLKWIDGATSHLWLCKPRGGFPFFEGAFNVQIALPLRMPGDIDGRMKAILDFLKKPAGIIVDDSKAFGASITRSESVAKGMCKVFVYEAPASSPAPARAA